MKKERITFEDVIGLKTRCLWHEKYTVLYLQTWKCMAVLQSPTARDSQHYVASYFTAFILISTCTGNILLWKISSKFSTKCRKYVHTVIVNIAIVAQACIYRKSVCIALAPGFETCKLKPNRGLFSLNRKSKLNRLIFFIKDPIKFCSELDLMPATASTRPAKNWRSLIFIWQMTFSQCLLEILSKRWFTAN